MIMPSVHLCDYHLTSISNAVFANPGPKRMVLQWCSLCFSFETRRDASNVPPACRMRSVGRHGAQVMKIVQNDMNE